MRKRSLFITLLSIFLTLCFCLGALTACGENTSSDPIELPPEETPKPPVVITPDDTPDDNVVTQKDTTFFDPQEDYDARMLKLKQKWDDVEMEIREDKFYLCFTKEYTVETLYHDYTPEDFEGVRISRVVEAFPYGTDLLRKKLAGEPYIDHGTFNFSKYRRGFYIYLFESSREAVYDAVITLSFQEGVKETSPLYAKGYGQLETAVTTDPYIDYQWALDKIDALDAWNYSTGMPDVLVGVVDTGIDSSHGDLINQLCLPTDSGESLHRVFSGTDGAGIPVTTPTDDHGHGTHVAGIIAAERDNFIGIAGIAPNIKLISLKVLDSSGILFDENSVVNAINYANQVGISILNMSFRCNDLPDLRDAIDSYFGIIICSAGNDEANTDLIAHYPSGYDYDNIISVGASTEDDERASFSNYGATTVDLFAPGKSILSTYTTSICNSSCTDLGHEVPGYHTLGGTSMAAPHVTAVAALIKSYYPNISTSHLKSHILSSVDPVTALSGKCVTGGRLNANNALGLVFSFEDVNTTMHNCICPLCGIYDTESHQFATASINATSHTRICSLCGFSTTTTHSYITASADATTHTLVCSVCGYTVTGNHNLTYRNLGEHVGHQRICSNCTYTEGVEFHTWDWKPAMNRYKCRYCPAKSASGWAPYSHEEAE